jgi:hypothetical protein
LNIYGICKIPRELKDIYYDLVYTLLVSTKQPLVIEINQIVSSPDGRMANKGFVQHIENATLLAHNGQFVVAHT